MGKQRRRYRCGSCDGITRATYYVTHDEDNIPRMVRLGVWCESCTALWLDEPEDAL